MAPAPANPGLPLLAPSKYKVYLSLFLSILPISKIISNYVTEKFGYDCFADDTGLEVEALNGAPGVYSARYAGEQKNSEDNMDKVLSELNSIEFRKAHFKTVIALNLNKKQHLFTGIIKGEIIRTKKGDQGFGYDPIFQPNNYNCTFAEISMEEKSEISHRGIATRKLIEFLSK